jgi:formylglycine-generating enzyme required for sulfatase activity
MKNILIIISLIISLYGADIYPTNGAVVDNINGIMWQDEKRVIEVQLSQAKGEEFCEKLNYKGYSNWRLPTKEEYESIVDKKNDVNFIHSAFRFNDASGYWTDDVLWRMLGFYGYYMNFKNGIVYYENKTYLKYIRCVRDIK